MARGGRRAYNFGRQHHARVGLRCRGTTYVALAANHLVAVKLASKSLERGLDQAATETEDEMECWLL